MHHLLSDIGMFTDNAFPMIAGESFWSTPLGLVFSTIIVVASFTLMHIKRSFWDALYYSAMGCIFLIAFLIGFDDRNPHHIVKVLLFVIAARFTQQVVKHVSRKVRKHD